MTLPRPISKDVTPGSMPSRPKIPAAARRHLVAVAALVTLGLLAYSNAFRGDFVFDDFQFIVDNPVIRDLSNYFVSSAGYRASPHRVVAFASFALNHAVGGLDPAGYHVVNIAIHLLNGSLAYALVCLLFRTTALKRSALADSGHWIALVAAALFVAHPLQTQAVAYVAQRMASLATTFYLLAVVLYLRWRIVREARPPGALRAVAGYVPILAVTIVAMKTKEIAFTLPLSVALLEAVLFQGDARRRALYVGPILATLPIIPLTMIDLGGSASLAAQAAAVTNQTDHSRWDYLITQLPAVATYLRLVLVPVGQNVDHDFPLFTSPFAGPVIAAAALLALVAGFAVWLLRRSRASAPAPLDPAARIVALGIAWFFLTLSVESSFIPIGDVFFEHRVYLPSVGLFAALATGGALVVARAGDARAKAIALAVGGAIVLVLAVTTFVRNEVWRSELSLWSDAAAKAPSKPRPHLNLGQALMAKHDVDAAIAQYRLALRADPEYVEAHNNLGVALVEKGQVDEAIAHLELAVALLPSDADAQYNLGLAYGRKGRIDLAREHMQLGMRLRSEGK
ncbi:tetratricopeptide repeat protein [Anaeromyxobacter sp. SG66]|uniref:tetratricopeptide repeat protein n=1 Tax=Anaeromyxobacter sp. SG66 TaxID=2925410 RepID=UPI001F589581|nr:tetratricopeptide repeat protein [Anaeromyxobacter sp. SG66]